MPALETLEWRRVGAPREQFRPLRRAGVEAAQAQEYAVLELETQFRGETPAHEAANGVRGRWSHYFDGATGVEFKSGWNFLRHDEVVRRMERPLPCDGTRIEIRDRRTLVLVRNGKERQVFPR